MFVCAMMWDDCISKLVGSVMMRVYVCVCFDRWLCSLGLPCVEHPRDNFIAFFYVCSG